MPHLNNARLWVGFILFDALVAKPVGDGRPYDAFEVVMINIEVVAARDIAVGVVKRLYG